MSQGIVKNCIEPEARYCRLCLMDLIENKFKPIFPLIDSTTVIMGMLEALTNVNILEEDEFSKLICWDCWTMLTEIKKFKAAVQLSDLKLKSRLTEKCPLTVYDNLYTNFEKTESITKVEFENSNNAGDEEQLDQKIDINELDLTKIKTELDSDNEQGEAEMLTTINRHELLENDPISAPKMKRQYIRKVEHIKKIVTVYKVKKVHSKHKCPECNKEFGKTHRLMKHLRIHRTKRCNICNHLARGRQSLFKHKIRHKLEKNFKCQTCDVVLPTEELWTEHNQIHIIKCVKCTETFETTDALLEHDKRIHQIKDINTYCTKCNEKFETNQELNEHLKTIHSNNIPGLCSCGKEVKNLSAYIHEKQYKCDICNISYCKRNSLDAHMNTHANKKVQCDICGKELASRKTLYYHKIAMHGDQKRFKCEKCGKEFNFKQHLKRHLCMYERFLE